MTTFINNPSGLSKTVLTPEVRAQSEAEARSFTRLLGKMSKKGLSFNGDDAFIDSASVKHYDKYGTAIEQAPAVVSKPLVEPAVYDETPGLPGQVGEVGPPGEAGLPGPGPVQRRQGYIGAPIQEAPPAITIDAIVHQFKIYDPVQQQILITILNQ